jgi:phosphoribosylformylglycinamidine synthase
MQYHVRIEVRLKTGHSDPEGDTTQRLLKELGYEVDDVAVSKVYRMTLGTKSKKEAEIKADEMCRRLLANPTKDNYAIVVEEEK